MRRWIIGIVIALVAIGALAGAGFAGYRVGFSQGAQFSGNADDGPRFTERFHQGGMPQLPFWHHPSERVFRPGGFHGRGFISPVSILLKVAVLGLMAWVLYKLFTGGSWQLSFTRQPSERRTTEPEPADRRETEG